MSDGTSESQTTNETPETEASTFAEALAAEAKNHSEDETQASPSKETAEAESVSESETESEKEAVTEGGADEVVPPEHWSDEDKQAFLKMDEVGRNLALRMEANYHKGIQEKSERLKKFTEALEPYQPMFGGADETQVIKQLLNAQAFLQRDPVNGLKWLAQNLQVDPSKLTESQKREAEEEDDQFVDPEVKKLKAELKALRDEAEQQQRRTQQEQQNAVFAEITSFRDETDEDGNKLRPHFGEVCGVMAGLLQSGRAQSLQDAYEQAVWAVPEYRDEIVRQQVEEQRKAEAERKAQEAEEAKKTAKSVNGKHSAKTEKKPSTFADELKDNLDKSVRGEL